MSEWISVKERLPEPSEDPEEVFDDYLVVVDQSLWLPSRFGSVKYVTCATYCSSQKVWMLPGNRPTNALIDFNSGSFDDSYVSHWMPLPEPPEEETDD